MYFRDSHYCQKKWVTFTFEDLREKACHFHFLDLLYFLPKCIRLLCYNSTFFSRSRVPLDILAHKYSSWRERERVRHSRKYTRRCHKISLVIHEMGQQTLFCFLSALQVRIKKKRVSFHQSFNFKTELSKAF